MTHVPSDRPLSSFRLLSFDIYGTLIDWESGIVNSLQRSPHFSSLPAEHSLSTRHGLLEAYEKQERALQSENPGMRYAELLTEAYVRIAKEHGLAREDDEGLIKAAKAFGDSVGTWPAFPDTVEAMQTLGKHYKLVALSNVDRESFSKTLAGPLKGVKFDAVYTAEDIGSYKPDKRNFEYLLEHVEKEFGLQKGDILHVAQSLYHDHVPAAQMGFESCWVDRSGAMGEVEKSLREKARFGWRVQSLGELAEMVVKEQK